MDTLPLYKDADGSGIPLFYWNCGETANDLHLIFAHRDRNIFLMKELPSGHELIPISKEFQEDVARKVQHIEKGCVVLKPGFHLLPKRILNYAQEIYDFPVRDTDVFVVSYPKCGSTWMQEIVWAMKHNPDMDHPESNQVSYAKCPFYEVDVISSADFNFDYFDVNGIRHSDRSFFSYYTELPSPRSFKSHLYFKLFNPKALETGKFIYMIRNPLDACVSFYHFSKSMKTISYPGTLEDFVDDYIKGKHYTGQYVEHVRQWWELRENPNIHAVFYENLRQNTIEELERLNKFLGTNLIAQQLKNIKHYTSLDEMKQRDGLDGNKKLRDEVFHATSDGYFRKGEIGSGTKELTEDLVRKLKRHFRENLSDIQLPYDFS